MSHTRSRFRASLLAAVAVAVAGTWATHAQTPAAPAAGAPFAVAIRVDASKSTGPLKPIWRFFGADEPNYAYMKDGQKLIRDIGARAPMSRISFTPKTPAATRSTTGRSSIASSTPTSHAA